MGEDDRTKNNHHFISQKICDIRVIQVNIVNTSENHI